MRARLVGLGRRGFDIEFEANYCIFRVFSGATVSPDRRECVSGNLMVRMGALNCIDLSILPDTSCSQL
jgi:hypothetical protein